MPVPQANSKTEPPLSTLQARRQILRVGLEQHRPEVTIIRRRDGSGKVGVFVFHISTFKGELAPFRVQLLKKKRREAFARVSLF